MSDTDTIRLTSQNTIDAEFLRAFGDRVESVEFVRREGDLEFRSQYYLRAPVRRDHDES